MVLLFVLNSAGDPGVQAGEEATCLLTGGFCHADP